jgi:hypothetical protein
VNFSSFFGFFGFLRERVTYLLNVLSLTLVGLLMAIMPDDLKAQGLGDLGANVESNISGVAKAILVGGFALGVYLVISGLVEFYNSNRKPNCSFSGGAIKCVIGACLLAVEALIASFSTTIFGGDESSSGLGVLGF